MASKARISVIMVDGSYRPHFGITDSLKEQTFPPDDYEVLWVEYFSDPDPALVEKTSGDPRFRLVTMNGEGTYHSSYCFNEGIRQARGELLVIVDADVITESNFLETVWREHQQNDRLVMYLFRYDEVNKPETRRLDLEYLRGKCVLVNASNYGGCLTVRKKWLLAINGYEEHEIFRTGGDHANGLDVFTRFKNLGLHVMWHPEHAIYHPWHPSNPRAAGLYRPQWVVTTYRALSRDTQPYKGLDRSQDRELPSDLQQKLRAEEQAAAAGRQAPEPKSVGRDAGSSALTRFLRHCKSVVASRSA